MLTVCAVLAACGCGSSPKRVRKPGDEYLAEIRFEGVSLDPPGQLVAGSRSSATSTRGRAIDEYQLSLDTQRIIGLYPDAAATSRCRSRRASSAKATRRR